MPRAKPDLALAAAVRRVRERQGLTREDLAFRVDVTVGSLARIELAQSSPSWGTVKCIAAALGVRVSELAAMTEVASPAGPQSQQVTNGGPLSLPPSLACIPASCACARSCSA